MKFQSIERDKRVITTVEARFLRKPIIRKFWASRRVAGDFWSWLELPGNEMIPDHLSFQLDAWLRDPPQVTAGDSNG